jgi:MFS family permease
MATLSISRPRIAPDELALGGVNPWVITFTVMLATFMEVLDTSVANVALPHIAGSLSATAEEATWVLTAYLVANASSSISRCWFPTLTPSNPRYQSMLHGTAQMLMQHGADAAGAMQKAHALLYGMVQRQAGMLAFVDIFWMLGGTFL